jgi:hypoxanthine phosphoribosyltransferase
MSEIKVAFDEETINRRIKELGAEIRDDAGDREVFLIGVLKGSSVFLGDVLRAIPGKVHFEWVHVVYEANDTEIADAMQIDYITQFSMEGQRIYVLKDIVASGVIETYLLTQFREKAPAALKLVALLDCPDARTMELTPDFSVFTTERGHFVGYGLEANRELGNLPYIGRLE